MPIKIPNGLPAAQTLAGENLFVMDETRAVTQDIRPLQILVLNLMPTKIETETQLSRLLGNTPLQVELEFLHTSSHKSKNTAKEHLFKFYQVFDQVKDRNFDGMVVTGAPVEQMPFEDVEYWPELCEIMAMEQNARLFHVPHLLGRTGGPLLPLRHPEIRSAGEALRRLPAHGRAAQLDAHARL